MTTKTIRSLKISNFKSIDSLEIKGLSPFSVFAGPNGSGKSNFFDALDFIRIFIESGIDAAIRTHGRYENIHSEKRKAKYARKFDFEIECELPVEAKEKNTEIFNYSLSIHDLNSAPKIEERLSIDSKNFLSRNKGETPILKTEKNQRIEKFPETYSALLLFSDISIAELLRNLWLYRIDRKGYNLASVLNRLEYDDVLRNEILEWMVMIFPGIEKIQTEQQQIDSKTAILFKEAGTRRRFPAHMISDGTIYALCLLVAILDSQKKYGITLIEEPERGLHPKAIQELIGLFRQQSSPRHPIWLSTHSESVVRKLKLEELVLMDKLNGKTRMKVGDTGKINQSNLAPLGLDEAWLSNLLDGGVPW